MLSPATTLTLLGRLRVREGGIGDLDDGAGTTYFGQTLGWLAQYNLPIPKTADEAANNYRLWLLLSGLDHLPDDLRLADAVVDYAINSGVSPAVRSLQRLLGFAPRDQDGVLGPQTRAALDALPVVDRFWALGVYADRLRTLGGWLKREPARATRLLPGVLNRLATLIESV